VTTSLPRWQCGLVASGGEDIYYELVERDPTAPTVVLTHGAGGSHAVWYQQVVALAEHYRVVTWDARGFGNSTYRSGVYSADASASDLAAVLDAVDTGTAHIVGQSMGGWWVTAFALRAPSRVRSVTLSNTIGGMWTDELASHYRAYVRAARADAEARAGEHPAIGGEMVEVDLTRAFLYQQLNTFHTPPLAEVGKLLATTAFDHDAVRAIDLPFLVLTSAHDPIFPAPAVRASISRIGATVVDIPDAGHSAYWERPDAYNAHVLAFLAQVDA
jgi:pimeloyl-ACP methyl ester carboxylesterase